MTGLDPTKNINKSQHFTSGRAGNGDFGNRFTSGWARRAQNKGFLKHFWQNAQVGSSLRQNRAVGSSHLLQWISLPAGPELGISAPGNHSSGPAASEMLAFVNVFDAQTIPNLEFSYVECLAAWPQAQGRRAPLTPPRRCCPPGAAPPARPRRASLQWRSKGCWEFWESLLRLRPSTLIIPSPRTLGLWPAWRLFGSLWKPWDSGIPTCGWARTSQHSPTGTPMDPWRDGHTNSGSRTGTCAASGLQPSFPWHLVNWGTQGGFPTCGWARNGGPAHLRWGAAFLPS